MTPPNRFLNKNALGNGRFLTGAVVGGLVTYVATNEAVQRAAINGLAHLWLSLKGGVEETKERFRDAESEIKNARAD
ncbi:hypothetical protein DSD19_07235 [Rhodovulum sp. BSW8]|uniref:YtxH-like protein n=1 Tax=Rhodovulum visakhapatnamense TaxID=364297 RepID=A0ABS1REX0_9RHOB|nr:MULTISPECIES: hypothetical protein [Rhodovulum]MBL3569748.1 hypothetical protein [Rhodovulum visakhapatnamense]MBL3577830.1 hypothetical protein [Rhodovulum visakhapatnamense]OLS42339.1 hypothetical protein BV509_20670 [Rhodovulum sulfidophilum]RBO53896.1 hypothetical protein DSD19_07235 [Rhodovulum sp. BSW8]